MNYRNVIKCFYVSGVGEKCIFFSNTYNIITFKYLEIKRIHRNMQSVRKDIYKILMFMHLIIILLVLDTPITLNFFHIDYSHSFIIKLSCVLILKINIFLLHKEDHRKQNVSTKWLWCDKRRKWGKITVQTFNKAKSVQGSENEHKNTFTWMF